jgi:hypothetical protein
MAKKAEDPKAEKSNRKSTVPRTEGGKKRSGRNATKFGIFSKETLLQGESRSECDTLREGLWESKQPGNAFEETLLDKRASNLWRQHRVLIAERAEIRRHSEFVEFDHEQKQLEAAEEVSQKTYQQISRRILPQPVGLIWSIENPEALARCIEILVELQQGIQARGFNSEEDALATLP